MKLSCQCVFSPHAFELYVTNDEKQLKQGSVLVKLRVLFVWVPGLVGFPLTDGPCLVSLSSRDHTFPSSTPLDQYIQITLLPVPHIIGMLITDVKPMVRSELIDWFVLTSRWFQIDRCLSAGEQVYRTLVSHISEVGDSSLDNTSLHFPIVGYPFEFLFSLI